MPRKPYNFKREKTTGEETHFSPECLVVASNGASEMGGTGPFTCPYTPLIPLHYLLSGRNPGPIYQPIAQEIRRSWNVRNNNTNKLAQFEKRWGGTMFSSFMSRLFGESRVDMRQHSTVSIQEWLDRDEILGTGILGYNGSTSSRETILSYFQRNKFIRYSQNTYSGAISPYSLYLQNSSGRYEPHMLAVVLPENYLYVKYHLLIHNTIPLDRIVVLINKELDRGDFENQPFKKLYREILPKIMKSSAQVWKVPREFIDENCFIESYKIKATNILERRREMEGIVEEFYETIHQGSPIPMDTSVLPTLGGGGGEVAMLGENGIIQWATIGTDPSRVDSSGGTLTTSNVTYYTSGLDPVVVDTERWTWEIPPSQYPIPHIVEGDTVHPSEEEREMWRNSRLNPLQEGEVRVEHESLVEAMRPSQIAYNQTMASLQRLIGIDSLRAGDEVPDEENTLDVALDAEERIMASEEWAEETLRSERILTDADEIPF